MRALLLLLLLAPLAADGQPAWSDTLLAGGPLPPARLPSPLRSISSDSLAVPEGPPFRHPPPPHAVPARLAGVVGGLALGSAALYVYQRHAWWAEENRTSFHFHDDGGYAEELDKVGHFHGTAVQAQVVADAFRWSGLTRNESALAGAATAWLLQLHVEVQDGYNALWGFDPEDLAANTLGAGYFYARERLDVLDPVSLKFSYWPSSRLFENRDGAFEGRPPSVIDDYMGHTYWVSFRVEDVLPDEARPYWPDWLCVAGGVSGHQLYTEEAAREYLVSLDVDLTRVLPAETWLGSRLRALGDFVHLPAPALRLGPRFTPYLLYYGQESP